jgi:hypothetical protein
MSQIHRVTVGGLDAHLHVYRVEGWHDGQAAGWYVVGCDEHGALVEDEPAGPFETAAFALLYGSDQIGADA